MLTYAAPVACATVAAEGRQEGVAHPIANKEDLLAFLKGRRNYDASVVSHELHADGRPHYHAYVRFTPKLSTRDVTFFDYNGVHPNIGTRENEKAMVTYVTKDGDYIADNLDVNKIIGAKTSHGRRETLYTEALNLAEEGKLGEARALLQKGDPIRWCTSNSMITAALANAHAEGVRKRNPPTIRATGWTHPIADLDLTAKEEGEDYFRTHVLVGGPGIGKTQVAKYLLQKAGCTNIFVTRTAEQLRTVIDNIDGFVFDELNVNAADVRGGRWTREAQIALVDREEEGAIPSRYTDVRLKTHVIRVITTNVLDRALAFEDGAIARRIKVHDLGDVKLFE